MPRAISVDEALSLLDSRQFSAFEGVIEDTRIEFKGSPYRLEMESAKYELAKDVSALANSQGGLILIGFRTSKDHNAAVEYVDACREFALDSVDVERHRKVLEDWICPRLHAIDIRCFPSPSSEERGVLAIRVPASVCNHKPYIVARAVDESGRLRGTTFGYFERIQDRIPETTAEIIRGHIRDGMRFTDIYQRLESIENLLGEPVAVPAMTSDADFTRRIAEAEQSSGRAGRPNLILAVTAQDRCAFPDIFRSSSSPLVQLLENPPVLRPNGFIIAFVGSTLRSEIIEGRLRRIASPGYKLLELSRDGTFIGVGPGDDDMLCWFMRNQRNPKPGLPIRNFVLTEVTLNFCRLAFSIFEHAEPKPKRLKFALRLSNMTDRGEPCKLSLARDGGPNEISFGFEAHSAPSETVHVESVLSLESSDPGEAAYCLLSELYVRFGFETDRMPYLRTDGDRRRITSEGLFPKA